MSYKQELESILSGREILEISQKSNNLAVLVNREEAELLAKFRACRIEIKRENEEKNEEKNGLLVLKFEIKEKNDPQIKLKKKNKDKFGKETTRACGHMCQLTTLNCCRCMDIRQSATTDGEVITKKYIDGKGCTNDLSRRDEYYCDTCITLRTRNSKIEKNKSFVE